MMLNLACLLTLSRILLTPVIIYFLLQQQWMVALIIFSIALLTDFFDGWIARKFSGQTKFGALLDPVADKILLGSVMITFLSLYPLQPWQKYVVFFLIIKEIMLLMVGGYLHCRYQIFIAPSRLSRLVSIAEMMLLSMMLVHFVAAAWSVNISPVLIINLILSVWLLVRYSFLIVATLSKSKNY